MNNTTTPLPELLPFVTLQTRLLSSMFVKSFLWFSHLLGVLFALVQFLVQLLLLVSCHRGVSFTVGFSGGRHLLLFAGQVVQLFGSLDLRETDCMDAFTEQVICLKYM